MVGVKSEKQHHHQSNKNDSDIKKRNTASDTTTEVDGGGSSSSNSKVQVIYGRRTDSPLLKLIRVLATSIFVIVMTLILWVVASISSLFLNRLCKLCGVKPLYYPLELGSRFWARTVLWINDIKVVVEGEQYFKICNETPAIVMYSHCSNVDPIVMMGYTSIPTRFIFKKELLYFVPLVFLLAYLCGHIPINRKKHQSAISSINQTAQIVKRNKACVVISPEGTRSENGLLKEFKKGPFHMAKNSSARVLPACFFGSHEIWPVDNYLPNSGTVYVRFLPSYQVTEKDDIDELCNKTRVLMYDSLCKPPSNYKPFPNPPTINHAILFSLGSIIVGYFLYHSLFVHIQMSTINNILYKIPNLIRNYLF